VNQASKITDASCDCIYSDEYTNCAHIGAVLLAVQDLSPTRFPFDFKADYRSVREKQRAEKEAQEELARQRMIDYHKRALEKATSELTNDVKNEMISAFELRDPEPVRLYMVYEEGYEVSVRFKVGRERLYFIKSLRTFISNMNHSTAHKYGKAFSWDHHEEDLDEDSRKIYHFIVQNYNYSEDPYYYFDSQSLVLNDQSFGNFIELLKEIGPNHSNIKLEEGDYHPTITLTKDADGDYNLSLESQHKYSYYLTKNTCAEIDNKVFYLTKLDENGITQRLLDTFYENDNHLFVTKENFNNFYQYVLLPIKDYITLKGLEKLQLEKGEDHIEIYGDIDEEEVAIFKVLACYNDGKKINVLSEPNRNYTSKVDLIENFIEGFHADMDDQAYYLDTNHEGTMDFLNRGIPFLSSHCDVYVSDALKKVGTKSKFDVSVGISVSNDLLSIDIDSIDIPKEELAAVLNSYKKKKKYHKLKNGEMLYIKSDEIDELSKMMDHYHLAAKDIKDGHIDMNLNRAFALDMDADAMEHVKVKRSEAFENVLDRLKNYQKHQYPLTPHYDHILRDYQKEGYQWLSTMSELGFGGILADDMGLGKTLQMVTLLENNEHNFSIIVCPSSLVLNWLDEFQKFSESLSAVAVMGNAQERKAIIDHAHHYNSLITSYDYLRRDIDLYKDLEFDFIVLDEAQYIKNQKTKNAISVKKLKGKHRFALTGTPIENSLAELWSIFDFLNKDYLFNYTYFKKQYEGPIVRDHDEKKQKELKAMISPFVLRRTKKQVLKELPDKVEKTISIEFEPSERKLYLAHLAAANKQLKTLDGKSDRIQILAMLTRLRQICCEPRMAFDNIKRVSSKLEACLDIIDNYKENGKKIIVFSSFKTALELIADELDKRDVKYHMLTGSTNKLKRKESVDAFQTDDSTVFLISLKAGGTGLNLTAAEGVIHFDPWWNMSAQSQATDRAHRIGQKNTVFVYKLIMADSIEEKIQKLQEAKKNLADTFVEGNDGRITSMTTDEIMSLFK
jgi:superfamily II DNA or RNA helicase